MSSQYKIHIVRVGEPPAPPLDDLLKRHRRLTQEIAALDACICSCADSVEREALTAERKAAQAELEYQTARFELEEMSRRVAYIYQQYEELGITKDNYEERLIDAAGDMFDFIRERDFLEPIINPGEVWLEMDDLRRKVDQLDREWSRAIESWHKVARPSASATRDLIAFYIDEGIIRVARLGTDGTWTNAAGTSWLPSGIYVNRPVDATLSELEELINDPAVTERNLQVFFEQHPELLMGTDYNIVVPQACIVPESDHRWRADFVLHPFDQTGFCKVLELKLPQVEIERSAASGHPRFFADLYAAIQQLVDYVEAFHDSETRARFQARYGVEVYRPDAQLIIGRRESIRSMRNFQDIKRRHQVEINDWDTFLERLRRRYS